AAVVIHQPLIAGNRKIPLHSQATSCHINVIGGIYSESGGAEPKPNASKQNISLPKMNTLTTFNLSKCSGQLASF
ncbi:hypothetical protein ABMA58_16460, partial [Oceanospirillum sp. HFRX-1_2]